MSDPSQDMDSLEFAAVNGGSSEAIAAEEQEAADKDLWKAAEAADFIEALSGGYVTVPVPSIGRTIVVQSINEHDYHKWKDLIRQGEAGKGVQFLLEKGMVSPSWESIKQAIEKAGRDPKRLKGLALDRLAFLVQMASITDIVTEKELDARFQGKAAGDTPTVLPSGEAGQDGP